jgi:hypothetical protein
MMMKPSYSRSTRIADIITTPATCLIISRQYPQQYCKLVIVIPRRRV